MSDIPTHIAFFILKNCLAIPKLTYILRCSPTWHSKEQLQEFDSTLRKTLEGITNNYMQDITWRQATLPVDKGGLGIRLASSLALPAYLSSFSSVSQLVHMILPDSFSNVSNHLFVEGEQEWISKINSPLPESMKKFQKAWDRPLIEMVAKDLLDSAMSAKEKARIKAVTSHQSGAWLNALPVASLGSLLDNESFRIAIGLRLGSPICVPHTCKCGASVDEKGTHGLSCKFSAGRQSRHHVVNDLLKRALTTANIPSILEPTGVSRDDGNRPDGMTLIPWKFGKPVVWDFTCVDTVATSHVVASSKCPGAAAVNGEKTKSRKYQNLQQLYIFYPVAVETFGVFGPNALEFIKDIGRRITEVTSDRRATTFLFQRIAIAIQRGNAASVLGTLPVSRQLNELFLNPQRTLFSAERPDKSLGGVLDGDFPLKMNSHNFQNTRKSFNYSCTENKNPNEEIDIITSPLLENQSNFSSPVQKIDKPALISETVHIAFGTDSESNSTRRPEADNGADDSPKSVMRELYPLDAVQLGWKNSNWSVGAGMVNMGNSCYLNSTLQALFHVPSLVNWLLSDKEHIAHCQDLDCLCIICAIRKTLQDSQQRSATSFSPLLIYNKLQLICQDLIPGRQEDAHEFLRYLVEAMEKAYLSRFEDSSDFDSRIKETTPLNQILGGFLRSDMRCLRCSHVNSTIQHFQDLLLDIRNAQTLDEALELFFLSEELDDECYQCDSCEKKVRATKQFSLERAPMVLCIQLKRFSVTNIKISKHLMFRQRLDLTAYSRQNLNVPLIYRLVAIVTHIGPTLSCGHYTTLAKTPTGRFYHFDDRTVRPVSHQTVLEVNPYMMFYELESSPFSEKASTVPQLSTSPSSKTPQPHQNDRNSVVNELFKMSHDGCSTSVSTL